MEMDMCMCVVHLFFHVVQQHLLLSQLCIVFCDTFRCDVRHDGMQSVCFTHLCTSKDVTTCVFIHVVFLDGIPPQCVTCSVAAVGQRLGTYEDRKPRNKETGWESGGQSTGL